jgi:hypothetical protein
VDVAEVPLAAVAGLLAEDMVVISTTSGTGRR